MRSFKLWEYKVRSMAEDGEQGGGAGPAESGSDFNPDDPRVQEFAKQYADSIVQGLKSKNSELIGKLKQFEGVDPEAYRKLQERLDKEEEKAALAEGNLDEIFERRAERERSQWQEQLNSVKAEAEQAKQTAAQLREQINRGRIAEELRRASQKAGVLPEAFDDLLRRGLDVFAISENGELEARDDKGHLRKVDGELLLTPERWIGQLRDVAPHFWGASQGAGAGGGKFGSTEDASTTLASIASENGGKIDMSRYREARKRLR